MPAKLVSTAVPSPGDFEIIAVEGAGYVDFGFDYCGDAELEWRRHSDKHLVPRLFRPDKMRSCGARDWCSLERSDPERFDDRGQLSRHCDVRAALRSITSAMSDEEARRKAQDPVRTEQDKLEGMR